jgi:hypothetical protein
MTEHGEAPRAIRVIRGRLLRDVGVGPRNAQKVSTHLPLEFFASIRVFSGPSLPSSFSKYPLYRWYTWLSAPLRVGALARNCGTGAA